MDRRAERYELASELYESLGVDTEAALARLGEMPISVPCWQGDDVTGFEGRDTTLGGGLAVTGAYPGRARNADELRSDLEFALRRIPGRHRVNLHASYAETGGAVVDRNALEPAHFSGWCDWAATHGHGLDFNPTFFAHPNASAGWTLAHPDAALRMFWIEHGQASRRIAASFGAVQGTPSINNVWIPDGTKEVPWDRHGPRERLRDALDQVFAERFPAAHLVDAVESKLFGIGSEGYVVGSHEFYLGYAASRQLALCLDSGHFHPTESIADKISSVLLWVPEVLLHVSRGVRWDSDHVVLLDDDTLAIGREVVRVCDAQRVHLGLDFFDASINRVAAWILGCRNLLKSLLAALLQPHQRLSDAEAAGDATSRLAWFEESKGLPWAAVWDEYCQRQNVAVGHRWLAEVQDYERQVLAQRG